MNWKSPDEDGREDAIMRMAERMLIDDPTLDQDEVLRMAAEQYDMGEL